MKTSEIPQNHNSTKSQHWFDSGQDDLARMIERTIAPYVDHGNVSLQRDELRDECWFKVAKLLSGSSLDRCQTRQQFFAFIKVSLKNHVRTQVHKFAFSEKRTGVQVPPKERTGTGANYQKTRYVRLDDPNEVFELTADASLSETNALLADFACLLSARDRLRLRQMFEATAPLDSTDVGRLREHYEKFLQA